jgi:hypothetical protein
LVYTAMEKSRIVTIRVWHGRQKLNDRQIPNFRGVRVALGTGYNRVEGNRRASRNGRVSSSPTRNPYRYGSQLLLRCEGAGGGGEEHTCSAAGGPASAAWLGSCIILLFTLLLWIRAVGKLFVVPARLCLCRFRIAYIGCVGPIRKILSGQSRIYCRPKQLYCRPRSAAPLLTIYAALGRCGNTWTTSGRSSCWSSSSSSTRRTPTR